MNQSYIVFKLAQLTQTKLALERIQYFLSIRTSSNFLSSIQLGSLLFEFNDYCFYFSFGAITLTVIGLYKFAQFYVSMIKLGFIFIFFKVFASSFGIFYYSFAFNVCAMFSFFFIIPFFYLLAPSQRSFFVLSSILASSSKHMLLFLTGTQYSSSQKWLLKRSALLLMCLWARGEMAKQSSSASTYRMSNSLKQCEFSFIKYYNQKEAIVNRVCISKNDWPANMISCQQINNKLLN